MNDIAADVKRGPGRPPKYEQASPAVDGTAELPVRPTRKPFGSLEAKLAYPQRAGFKRHWFNDTPGRVQRAQEAGWVHVKGDDGKNVCRIVGTAEGGGGLNGYLMETPQAFYDEDMAAQQAQVDAKEAAMRRGDMDKKDGDGRYVPSQGISIKHGN